MSRLARLRWRYDRAGFDATGAGTTASAVSVISRVSMRTEASAGSGSGVGIVSRYRARSKVATWSNAGVTVAGPAGARNPPVVWVTSDQYRVSAVVLTTTRIVCASLRRAPRSPAGSPPASAALV